MSHTPLMVIDILYAVIGALSICISVYLALLVKGCPPRYYYAYYVTGVIILLLNVEPWTSIPVGLLAEFTGLLLLLAIMTGGLVRIVEMYPEAHPRRALRSIRAQMCDKTEAPDHYP